MSLSLSAILTLAPPFVLGGGDEPIAPADLRVAAVARLRAIDDLTALVGERIFPDFRPQSQASPCVCVSVIDETEDVTIAAPGGCTISRLQIDIYSRVKLDAIRAKKAIRQALHGTIGDWEDLTVRWCKKIGEADLSDRPDDGSDQWAFRISQDFWVKYDTP